MTVTLDDVARREESRGGGTGGRGGHHLPTGCEDMGLVVARETNMIVPPRSERIYMYKGNTLHHQGGTNVCL